MPRTPFTFLRSRTTLGLLTLGAGSALVLSGCATSSTDTAASGATSAADASIVVTTTQVADFTRNLVPDAEITQLIGPNESVHAFDPSAAQLLALTSADIVIANGAGLETWLDEALDAAGFEGTLIDASSDIDLDAYADADESDHDDHDHAEDEHDHAEDEDHADADDDHDHGGVDPHVWTSPHLAEEMVNTIAEGLEEALPSDASAIEANATAYTEQLEELDGWIHENIDLVNPADRLLVSNHDVFGYFVADYDIDFLGSVIPSLDDHAEPSAAEMNELVAAIKATGATAVFSEASLSPQTAETIANEAGVTVYSGDDALYADSLGAVGSDGETYIGAQLHNVTLMLESWGAVPTAIPAALTE